jgi:hypothetical protein
MIDLITNVDSARDGIEKFRLELPTMLMEQIFDSQEENFQFVRRLRGIMADIVDNVKLEVRI